MSVNAVQGAVVTVGAIALVLTLLGGFGVGPLTGLSATCPVAGGPSCQGQQVFASFTLVPTGLAVTLTDHSWTGTPTQSSPCIDISHIAVTWGDLSHPQTVAPCGKLVHNYAANGTYSVTEKVWATFSPPKNATTTTTFSNVSASTQSVTLGTTTNHRGWTLTAKFTLTLRNQSVSFRDLSIATNVSVTTISVAWGDGGTSLTRAAGALNHTYVTPNNLNGSKTRNFTVTETVNALTATNGTVMNAASQNLNVTFSNAVVNPPPPVPAGGQPTRPLFTLNLFTGGLIAAELMLIIVALLPIDILWRVVLFAVGTGLGLLLGWFV